MTYAFADVDGSSFGKVQGAGLEADLAQLMPSEYGDSRIVPGRIKEYAGESGASRADQCS